MADFRFSQKYLRFFSHKYVLISTQDTQSFVIVIFIDLNFGSFFGNLRLILQSFFK